MGQRQDKKLNRQIRREARKVVKRNKEYLQNYLKPKPSWVPWPVWMWAIGFFIDYKGVTSKD